MNKLKLKIEDMHCTSCALSIDMDLEDLEGVQKSSTSYAKAETEVVFDLEKVDENMIIETIKTTGYSAIVNKN